MSKKSIKPKKPSAKTMSYAQGGAMTALADALGGNMGGDPGQDGQVAPRGNVVQRVQNFNDPQHGAKSQPMSGKPVEHKQPGTTTKGAGAVNFSTGDPLADAPVTVNTAAKGAAVMTDEERKKKLMEAMMGGQPGQMKFGTGMPGAPKGAPSPQLPGGMPNPGGAMPGAPGAGMMPPMGGGQGMPGMPGMGGPQGMPGMPPMGGGAPGMGQMPQQQPQMPGPAKPHQDKPMPDGFGVVDPVDMMMAMRRRSGGRKAGGKRQRDDEKAKNTRQQAFKNGGKISSVKKNA